MQAKDETKTTPSAVVVKTFGGVRATARVLKISPGAVSRWGDLVPSRHHVTLLDAAKAKRLRLSASDLVFGRKAA